MKSFLLVFDPAKTKRSDVTSLLDSRWDVKNWVALLNNMVLVTAAETTNVNWLTQAFRTRFPNVYCIVTEIKPNTTDGWLPRVMWEHLNTPRSSKGALG